MVKRINWINIFKKNFKKEPFTVDDLEGKVDKSRTQITAAVRRNIDAGNLIELDEGVFQVATVKKRVAKIKEKGLPPKIKIFLKRAAEKFGDEIFSTDDAQELLDIKRSSTHGLLHKIFKMGLIKRAGIGVYKITDDGHNELVDDFKKEEKVEEVKAPKHLPSCILSRMESILGEEKMKEWVYAIAMVHEECVGVLEEEAIKAIVKRD